MDALHAEVERRAQVITERKIVGDVEGWRPTGIIHALTGDDEVTRRAQEVTAAFREAQERVTELPRYDEIGHAIDTRSPLAILGRPTWWDGSALYYGRPYDRDEPVDLVALQHRDRAALMRQRLGYDTRAHAAGLDRMIDDTLNGPQPVDGDRVRRLIDERVSLDDPDRKGEG
jgi:hypothetical protein